MRNVHQRSANSRNFDWMDRRLAFLTSLSAVFVALVLVVNAVLYVFLVRPVRRMAQIADQVSVGDSTAPEFPATGGAEIAALGAVQIRLSVGGAWRARNAIRQKQNL